MPVLRVANDNRTGGGSRRARSESCAGWISFGKLGPGRRTRTGPEPAGPIRVAGGQGLQRRDRRGIATRPFQSPLAAWGG
jgi:hypothetical protein